MKKKSAVLLLLPIVLLVMAQFAAAQDNMSAILTTPYVARPGSQLVYYFNEGQTPNGDIFKSYLTITNLNPDTNVLVHIQFYNVISCVEVYDYVDILTKQDTTVINPADLEDIKGDFRGQVSGGRFLVTITAIDATRGQGVDTRAISFNQLTGTFVITNVISGSAWGGNAAPRMAVNAFGYPLPSGSCFTDPIFAGGYASGKYAIGDGGVAWNVPPNPMPPGCDLASGPVIRGYTVTGLNIQTPTLRDPNNPDPEIIAAMSRVRLLQMFRPSILYVPHFFGPTDVDPANHGSKGSETFGNRLTVISVVDMYADAGIMHKLRPVTTVFTAWFIDNDELPYSLGEKRASCVTEWVVSPRNADTSYAGGTTGTAVVAGVGPDFIVPGIWKAADKGGFLKLTVTGMDQAASTFGWFSQSLSAGNLSTGVGDQLLALGRVNVTVPYGRIGNTTQTTNLPAFFSQFDAQGSIDVSIVFDAASVATP